jgi:hypothetical protein
MAQAGRRPDSNVTVAQLLDQYVSTAGWDVSTRDSNLIHPLHRQACLQAYGGAKGARPILDKLYAELKRCGDLSCTAAHSPSTVTSGADG